MRSAVLAFLVAQLHSIKNDSFTDSEIARKKKREVLKVGWECDRYNYIIIYIYIVYTIIFPKGIPNRFFSFLLPESVDGLQIGLSYA